MIKPSLPQDRAALIDKDFRVTLPYRRWMSDVTKRLAEIDATETDATTTETPALTVTGVGGISVTGSVAAGYLVIAQRADLTPISKTLAYDGSDRLSVVTDDRGTKTMTYDGSDKLIAIAGTGEYPDMTFTYSGDQLTAVTVT